MTGVLDTFGLDGRVVVITGASSGLGAAVAFAVAQAGADVVIGARRREMLEATAARVEGIGRKALVVPTDITVVEDCQRLVQRAAATFGRVDGLVNNAGVATAVPALQESPEQFRAVIDLNLMGAYWTAQAAAAAMTSGGSIVNVSSIIGLTSAELPQAAYATSKAGLLGLTRDLAAQWSGRRSIRVQCRGAGFLRIRDDRSVPPRVPRSARRTDTSRPHRASGGDRLGGGVPPLRCGQLHDRIDPGGRRGPLHRVIEAGVVRLTRALAASPEE